jgi:hypothetical protein
MSGSQIPEWRKQRVVKNELSFRDYNERRDRIERGLDENVPFVCECGDDSCIRALMLTPQEWEAAHSAEDRFVVLPDHVFLEVERVVERHDGYWVVEKFELPSDTLA